MKKIMFLLLGIFCSATAVSAASPFFEIKRDQNGIPQLYRDGKPMLFRVFLYPDAYEFSTNADQSKYDYGVRQIIQAKAINDVNIGHSHTFLLWEGGDDEATKEKNRRIIKNYLDYNPDGFYLARMLCNPPAWWCKKHPEAMSVYNDGRIGTFTSLSSPVYRDALQKAIKRTIEFLEAEFPGKVIGGTFCGLSTSEWLYITQYMRETEGHDKATLENFRVWLKEKYKTDAALQKAWNDPKVTLATATVTTHAERKGDGKKFLKEPAVDARILDFEYFHGELPTQTIVWIAKYVRSIWPGRIIGFYNAYHEIGSWYGGGSKTGYLGLRKVLDSPDIDFLCAPFSYNWRNHQHPLATQAISESVTLSGKLWMNEDDSQTHHAFYKNCNTPSKFSACHNAEETHNQLRRNQLFSIMKNQTLWWMDLGACGWFDDAKIWYDLNELEKYARERLTDSVPFAPEIALTVDHQGAYHFVGETQKENSPVHGPTALFGMLGTAGAPHGAYLSDDILAGKVPSCKLAVFMSSYAMTKKQRTQMREFAKDPGCIWVWAPGYIDLETGKYSLEAVKEATGFEVKLLPPPLTPIAEATQRALDFKCPRRVVHPARSGSVQMLLTPVTQKGDEILAVYGDRSPAIVLRMVNGKPHVFCGTTEFPPEILHYVAKRAGVHLYTPVGPGVYANSRGEIGIYATKEGNVPVVPKKPGTYVDFFSGKKYSGKLFTIPMKMGQSVLLLPQK